MFERVDLHLEIYNKNQAEENTNMKIKAATTTTNRITITNHDSKILFVVSILRILTIEDIVKSTKCSVATIRRLIKRDMLISHPAYPELVTLTQKGACLAAAQMGLSFVKSNSNSWRLSGRHLICHGSKVASYPIRDALEPGFDLAIKRAPLERSSRSQSPEVFPEL